MSNLWVKVAENNEDSLETAEWEKDYQERGYNLHGWRDWQHGNCLEYAHALIREKPSLRFGAMGWGLEDSDGDKMEVPSHYFAHDDTHAYDSAGKHPLPYKGIDPDKTNHADWSRTDQDPEEHEDPNEDTINRAREHVREHGILEGKYQGKTPRIAVKVASELLSQTTCSQCPDKRFADYVTTDGQTQPLCQKHYREKMEYETRYREIKDDPTYDQSYDQ